MGRGGGDTATRAPREGRWLARARSGPEAGESGEAGEWTAAAAARPGFGRGLLRIASGGLAGGGCGGMDGDGGKGVLRKMRLLRFTPTDGEEEGGSAGAGGVGRRRGGIIHGARVGEGEGEGEGEGFEQAAGHGGAFRAAGPVLEKVVGERERLFYEDAFVRGKWPVGFLPKYGGVVEGSEGGDGDGRIRIENLVYGMECPCVLDFKLGTSSVEADEPNVLKKARMKGLDIVTRTKAAGVRLEGMSVHRVLEQAKIKTSKNASHVISASIGVTLQDVLMFFLTDESGVRTDIALRFLSHIQAILAHFENDNRSHLFIGSSILLVYDNDNLAPRMRWAHALAAAGVSPDSLSSLTRRTKVDVRMIDFAHTGPLPPGQVRDEGYITGLRSILAALSAISAGRARPIFSVAAAANDAVGASVASRENSASGLLLPGGLEVFGLGEGGAEDAGPQSTPAAVDSGGGAASRGALPPHGTGGAARAAAGGGGGGGNGIGNGRRREQIGSRLKTLTSGPGGRAARAEREHNFSSLLAQLLSVTPSSSVDIGGAGTRVDGSREPGRRRGRSLSRGSNG